MHGHPPGLECRKLSRPSGTGGSVGTPKLASRPRRSSSDWRRIELIPSYDISRSTAFNDPDRWGLQILTMCVEETRMSRCHQCGGYGHRPQPSVPRQPPPPLVSTQTLMCARCGDPLDEHLMFSECFPHGYLKESSLLLHRARLIAV